MKVKELLAEGTWSLPDNVDAIYAVKKLFDAPLSPKDIEKLYDYFGDDDLFDAAAAASEKKAKDVRPYVIDRAIELLDTSIWSKKPDEETAFHLRLLAKYLTKLKSTLQ